MLAIIGGSLVALGLARFAYASWVLRLNRLTLRPKVASPRIAVLIPARDESRVINGILGCLKAQTMPVAGQDIYVIVESLEDPTVGICRQFGCQVILRQDLSKQRKGYALDEAVKQILPRRHYDMYFIFDADNLLAPDYIEQMVKRYYQGYEMVTGYRGAKNANDNVIAAVSSLTFSMINILGNQKRIKRKANVIFSGTGCFVTGNLVEQWQGWPFHSLTEDYEMSLYAILHAIPTFYNEDATFYDEQPTKYKQTVLQRVRWIKGYFMSRKQYVPLLRKVKKASNIGSVKREIVGVNPLIVILMGLAILMLDGAVMTWITNVAAIWIVVAIVGVVYLVLMLVTVIILKRERLELRRDILVKVILFNPLYLVTYIPCAIRAILTRNVAWKKIEHGK